MPNTMPAVKWTGSKRMQAHKIVRYFPDNTDIYYEPFCGGCSVLFEYLQSRKKAKRYKVSDINRDLVNLLLTIRDAPKDLFTAYKEYFGKMTALSSVEDKQKFYNEIREKYNEDRSPADFFFINRNCYNGLIRYNSKGDFNVGFHLNRNGVEPAKIKHVLFGWSYIFRQNNVEIDCCDYKDIKADKSSFIYCDPPYAQTSGIYYGGFDRNEFFGWLKEQPCGYAFSYDGYCGEKDNTQDISASLYDKHIYLNNGISSFRNLAQVKNNNVFESLYIKERSIL